MSILSRLFGSGGGGGGSAPEPEVYNDFRIYVEPAKEAAGYRISARIEKDVDGETKVHHMVRADVISGEDEARQATLAKA